MEVKICFNLITNSGDVALTLEMPYILPQICFSFFSLNCKLFRGSSISHKTHARMEYFGQSWKTAYQLFGFFVYITLVIKFIKFPLFFCFVLRRQTNLRRLIMESLDGELKGFRKPVSL